MLRADTSFSKEIEAAVGALEAHTQAELVVVVSGRSGSYRDLSLLAAACASALALVFVLFAPVDFHSAWVPLDLMLIFGAVNWLLRRAPPVLALMASQDRKRDQVSQAAAAAFHSERVHATRERVGVLIYVSLLERQVHVICDQGVLAHIAPALVQALPWSLRDTPSFLASLQGLGALLGEHMPGTPGRENLISNAPRIHP